MEIRARLIITLALLVLFFTVFSARTVAVEGLVPVAPANFLLLSGEQVKSFLPLVLSDQSVSGPWTLLNLPDTGQVTSYASTFGEDSDYLIHPPTYTVTGDGTVTDQVTALVWQQTDGGEMTWANVLTYCQALDLAAQTDWRLPSAYELYSILDHDRNPALDPAVFTATAAEYWWTANEQVGDSTRAWVVNAGGGTGAHPKSETISAGGTKRFHVRCVRSVSAGVPIDLTDNGNVTVSDHNTGLVWQQGEVTPSMTWDAALTYCENLSLGDREDWRLPNIKELQSISDDPRFHPAIDTTYFPQAQSARYWSSTTLFGRTTIAWFLDFSGGLTSYNDKAGSLAVRCVRSELD